MLKISKLILKGFCIGTADIIPGVSGGTMAFVLGIYPQLINAIKSFDLLWLRAIFRLNFTSIIARPHLSFLIPLAIGAVLALFFFTRIISLAELIHKYPAMVYGLFFGLILGSTILLLIHIDFRILIKKSLFILLGLVFSGAIFLLTPASTPNSSWFIFICGMMAISAMILPGISGSFILLMMKKYEYILTSISFFDLSVIIPFGCGMVIGIVLFSRLLSYLLSLFYNCVVLFIIGSLLASLFVIWPFQNRVYEVILGKERLISSTPYFPDTIGFESLWVFAMMIIGLMFVLCVNQFSYKNNNLINS